YVWAVGRRAAPTQGERALPVSVDGSRARRARFEAGREARGPAARPASKRPDADLQSVGDEAREGHAPVLEVRLRVSGRAEGRQVDYLDRKARQGELLQPPVRQRSGGPPDLQFRGC